MIRTVLTYLVALAWPWAVAAQQLDRAAVDPATFELGMQVYKPALGNCEACHGWAGSGVLAYDFIGGRGTEPVVSLVTSKLDRAAMLEIVSCGRIGPGIIDMPQFLYAAWTREHPCGGKTAAELGGEKKPPVSPVMLSRAQIEAAVTFVQAFYVGREMTYENCRLYWGATSPACNPYR